MPLVFEPAINLTEYPYNTPPLKVLQLSIMHEAIDGELVQYYINKSSYMENDKSTAAIGVPIIENSSIVGYDYVYYDEVKWSKQTSRITRQALDRLGFKSFPSIGSIGFYKLRYRLLSRILIPVNTNKKRDISPTFTYEYDDANGVYIRISDPVDNNGKVTTRYSAYRVMLTLGAYTLEYVTYSKTIHIRNVPVSGTYLCSVIGYLENDEASAISDAVSIELVGLYNSWPTVTNENMAAYFIVEDTLTQSTATVPSSAAVNGAIDNAVSVASVGKYYFVGSVSTYANLPSNLTVNDAGMVYNVENAYGNYPPGTNFAWTGYYWDALGGEVDLTGYAKESDIIGYTQADIDYILGGA